MYVYAIALNCLYRLTPSVGGRGVVMMVSNIRAIWFRPHRSALSDGGPDNQDKIHYHIQDCISHS